MKQKLVAIENGSQRSTLYDRTPWQARHIEVSRDTWL